jgi:hypothetical protein
MKILFKNEKVIFDLLHIDQRFCDAFDVDFDSMHYANMYGHPISWYTYFMEALRKKVQADEEITITKFRDLEFNEDMPVEYLIFFENMNEFKIIWIH